MLAALLALIAIGVYLPPPAARTILALAVVVSAVIWVAGQDLGGILTGTETDPSSGPLLILLVLAYWPMRTDGARTDGARAMARADGARAVHGPAAGRAMT